MKPVANSKTLRLTLVTSISALALAVAAPEPAGASTKGWWVEIGGQIDFWDPDGTQYYVLDDSIVDVDHGIAGTVEIGYQRAGSPWSFALRGKVARSDDEKAGISITYYSSFFGSGSTNEADVTAREHQTVLDFEVGRDVGLGILGVPKSELKVVGGVRYTNFRGREKGTATYSYSYSGFGSGSYSGSIDNKRRFRGAGPRIGLVGSVPFHNRAAFDFSIAGAALFGDREVKLRDNLNGISINRKDDETVWNLEASAGVSFLLPDVNGKASFGYMVDAYYDVIDVGYFDRKLDDRIIHGPYVKLKFGGS